MVKKYIEFIIKATNQHGVHSPFVYKLLTECLYKKSPSIISSDYKNYRNDLKNNKGIIEVLDLGAGSRSFKSNKRKVSDIAKNAGISTKYALLLNRLINYLGITSVLELGTSLGLGSAAMCIHNKNLKVDTLEGCPETLNIAKLKFENENLTNQIRTHQGDFKDLLPDLLDSKKYDLIYFDGNHQKEATLDYFKLCLENKHNDSVFIFDDIYWSDGMQEAWEEIKSHPEVKVTVDLFRWGLVFFRREQVKEHFKIRF